MKSVSAKQAVPTKTARFLNSFQSVELLPEHCNYGDETWALRDLGMAPSIATALIRWGEKHDLVCTFENKRGVSNNAHSWQPVFLVAAGRKHIELYGPTDLPAGLLRLVSEASETRNAPLALAPLYTSQNNHRSGGRKTHLANAGVSLCGLVERADHLLRTLGDDLSGKTAIRAWIDTDGDRELCARCRHAALLLIAESSS